MSVMPKVLTAEFFRRNIADKIRCMAVAPGYVGTAMVKNIDEKVIGNIIDQVPTGRSIEPEEVVALVAELYLSIFQYGGMTDERCGKCEREQNGNRCLWRNTEVHSGGRPECLCSEGNVAGCRITTGGQSTV
jgi:hypothetical protein